MNAPPDPQMKRVAPGRAARGAFQTTQTNCTALAGAGQVTVAAIYCVVCTKRDGRHVEFQRYPTRTEAEVVAQRLRDVGCAARVASTHPNATVDRREGER